MLFLEFVLHLNLFLGLKVHKVRQSYGSTETSAVAMIPENEEKENSVGTPFPPSVEVNVVDVNTRKILGPNQIGELYIRSDLMFSHYIGNQKATEDAFEDGFFKSGDLGYHDEDNFLYIVDRIKEVINYYGENVFPSEVERLLLEHPSVEDAAVIGVPDTIFEEVAFAFVVSKPDATITENDIIQFVKENLSTPKQLHGGARIVKEFPRNLNGKVSKQHLKELVLNFDKLN